MCRLRLALLLTVPVWSQVFLAPLSDELKHYLELTPTQVTRLTELEGRFRNFQVPKLRRSRQVTQELSQELARPTMDPLALGVRSRELELIRREVATERELTEKEAANILNPTQREKLGLLEQTLRLRSTACEAAKHVLLPLPDGPAAGAGSCGE